MEKDPNAANFPTTVWDTRMATFGGPQYYSSTDPENSNAAAALLQPMSLCAFTETTRHGGVEWTQYGIPVHYVGCKKDADRKTRV